MAMQWLQNEWKAFREEISQKVEGIQRSQKDEDLIQRVEKLEGELKAMKARMGKQQKQEQARVDER